ncbi:MAG TPA: Hsp20/alpha crystallin family protein [Dehalococcoidia bacterium]|nr:Hsp20/alpha crystallin family protein [Dehalococcoidia bacterium]
MVLQRWDPFSDLRRVQQDMDRLWRGFMPAAEHPEMESWAIPLDVAQEGDNIVVHASMPGVKPDDIQVSIENNVLTIKGQTKEEKEHQEGDYLMRERRAGGFHRSLRLPDTVDTEKAKPYYENGVLTVSFPKVESKKAKQLKVTVGKVLESDNNKK